MPRNLTSLVLMFVDLMIVLTVPFLALFIRLEGSIDSHYYSLLVQYLPVMVLVPMAAFCLFGLYNRIWRYASISEVLAIIGAITLASLIVTLYIYADESALPRSLPLMSWFLYIAFIGASRMFIRILQHLRQPRTKPNTKILIVGAGDAGAMIAREILNSKYCSTKKLIGFIDDAQEKTGQKLLSVRVLGTRKDIRKVVEEYNVNEIIIAMPSITGDSIREIVHECKATGCVVKTLPGIYELIDGKITVQQLRNVEIKDLLRRDPVKLNLNEIAGYLSGKRVVVTGAGGSIGSELCRQIAKMSPASIALLGRGENSIYEIHGELQQMYPKMNLEPIIADIRDINRINHVFTEFKPQVVFHAAAHKHVPLMEIQPIEAVKNNIFGTKTVAEAADRAKAELFVMISTDKAVNPTSVMGATKRVAELIIQYLNRVSTTKFMAVRFGNVLGSRGSVIPLFKKQIAQGNPITVTHPEMQRYFMTIPEAVQLVLQAGAMANGGEVFVLDMGKPVKILDMAHDLIELSGLRPHVDVQIKFTGLRPGEKLFEELLTAEEGTSASKHEKIFVANLKEIKEEVLLRDLLVLQNVENRAKVIEVLGEIIPAYKIAREKYGNSPSEDVKGGKQTIQGENETGLDQKYPPAVSFSR